MCTFNGQAYLGEQLESLAAQTRLPAELVVRDDGSTDETVPILEQFARTALFPVRVTRNATRLGIPDNFAAAISDARCELIALADQDDRWYPHKLERLDRALHRGPRRARRLQRRRLHRRRRVAAATRALGGRRVHRPQAAAVRRR